KGIAHIGALQQVEENAIRVCQAVEIRLRHGTTGGGDALLDGIRGPIAPSALIRRGQAVQVKADSPSVPAERIVVVIEVIPAGIHGRTIAGRSGRRSELLRVGILRDRESRLTGKAGGLVQVPVAATIRKI